MSISGGLPQSWIKPLDHQGNTSPGEYGSHRGPSAMWNIPNPTPGYIYAWCRPDQEYTFRTQGWEPVPPESGEFRSPLHDDRYGSMLDSMLKIGNLLAIRIPERTYALIWEQKQERARGNLTGATEAYLNSEQALAEQERFGHDAAGPIRYQRAHHGIRKVSPEHS